MIVYDFFFIFSAVVTRSYVVMLMIRELFELLWAILLFYVFYQLLRGYLQRIANGSNRFSAIHSFHWVVIVILSALSAAQWSVYIADQVYNVEGNDQFIWLLDVYIKLFSVRYILCWVISLELLVWIAFVAFKSGAHRFSVRVSGQYTFVPRLESKTFLQSIHPHRQEPYSSQLEACSCSLTTSQ